MRYLHAPHTVAPRRLAPSFTISFVVKARLPHGAFAAAAETAFSPNLRTDRAVPRVRARSRGSQGERELLLRPPRGRVRTCLAPASRPRVSTAVISHVCFSYRPAAPHGWEALPVVHVQRRAVGVRCTRACPGRESPSRAVSHY